MRINTSQGFDPQMYHKIQTYIAKMKEKGIKTDRTTIIHEALELYFTLKEEQNENSIH